MADQETKTKQETKTPQVDKNVKGCLVLIGICLCMVVCIGSLPDSDTPSSSRTYQPAPSRPVQSLTNSQRSMMIDTAMGNPEVVDASVRLENEIFWLGLAVNYGISKARARQLGENFVRTVKALGPDTSPGKRVGTGRYVYIIAVGYPNEEVIAQGEKMRLSSDISWD